MQQLSLIFADARWRSLCWLIGLSIIIWFLGPYIAIAQHSFLTEPSHRMIAILILTLLWRVNNLRLKTHKKDLTAAPSSIGATTALPAEIKLLHQNFKHAWRTLRQSLAWIFFTRQRLPTYIVMGSNKSGKKSLLTYFGQQPTISDRYLDWWLIQKTVFLDLAAHIASPSQPLLQQTLFKLLRSYQRRLPLRGIIITLDLPQLQLQDQKAQQAAINKITQQLKELAMQFHQIPLYIVCTQCDLIAGFNEFFANFPADERNKALGFLLPTGQFQSELIAKEFDALLKRFNELIIWRLHQEINPQKRAIINDFPLQLQTLKPLLMQFIQQIIHTVPFNLRGCYFISNMQQGYAHDFLMTPMNAMFNLTTPATATSTKTSSSKPYFIEQLLQQIIADQPTNTVTFTRSHTHVASYAAAAMMLLAISSWSLYNYFVNKEAVNALHHALTNIVNPNSHSNSYSSLHALNNLAEALQQVDKSKLINLPLPGYRQANQLAHQANSTYQQLVTTQFLPLLRKILENQLQTTNPANFSQLYSTLKTYLMLTDPTHRDPIWVQQWFQHYWQHTLTNNQQQAELSQLLTLVLQDKQLKANADENLIASTRATLNKIPLLQLSYSILNDRYSQKNLDLLKPNRVLAIKDNYSISTLYAKENLTKILQQDIPEACQEVTSGNWILGLKSTTSVTSANSDLIKQVQTLYLNQYSQAWQQLLNEITFASYQDLTDAAQNIQTLGSNHSPLLELLRTISTNTAATDVPEFNQMVSSSFTVLNNFTQHSTSLITSLNTFGIYLNTLTQARNVDKAAFMLAAKRMEDPTSFIEFTQLSQQLASAPPIIQTWLGDVPAHVWQMQLTHAQNYLNLVWSQMVLPTYNDAINNRYPLFKNANDDIALTDFAKFFASGGIIDTFFNVYLKPFVDTSHFYWVWKTVDNQHIDIPQPTLEMFMRATLIEKMYFNDGSNKPNTRFALIPVALEPGVSEFNLNLDGQNVVYLAGKPQTLSLEWPGRNPGYVSMQFTSGGKQASFSTEGDWAWFKLLDKANLQSTTNPRQFNLTFDLNGNSVKYKLLANDLVNPFIRGIVTAFRCPDKL